MGTDREQGSSVISYAILLPLFLMLLFASYYAWEIIAVKQALNRAVYLAARSIANPGRDIRYDAPDPAALQIRAKSKALNALYTDDFVRRRFEKFEGRPLTQSTLDKYMRIYVDIDPAPGLHVEREDTIGSSLLFEVSGELEIPWIIKPPFLPERRVTISARHEGTFYHSEYFRRGQKPVQDPEEQPWRVFPPPQTAP